MNLLKKMSAQIQTNAANGQSAMKYKNGTYSYVNFDKQELYGEVDEVLVTNKRLIEHDEDYFNRKRAERAASLENHLHSFRTINELTPIYDPTGNGVSSISFVDENDELYDYFYDKTTMQLIPSSAFSYPQTQIRYIAPPGGGKTVKCLGAMQMLALIGKYYEGFCFNYDYPMDSKERGRIKKAVRDYQRGKLPERNKCGEELEPIPVRIDTDGKVMTFEEIAEPGEVLVSAGRENGLYGNPNIIPVLLIPPDEYQRMADGETETDVMEILDRFDYYGIQRNGIKQHQRVIVMFPQFDLFQNEKNEHIQKILAQNTIGRDEDGRLFLYDEGVLDLEKMMEMQKEIFAYIKETNSILFNKLKRIAKYCQVDIFVNADLNQRVEGLEYDPKEIVPFRTDEFWLYLLYINGMVRAKRGNTEEPVEQQKKSFSFDDFLNLLKGAL